MRRGILIFILLQCIIVSAIFPLKASYAVTTTVKVGYCEYMKPYQFKDEDGNAMGFHIDILNGIAENEDLICEYIPFVSTSAALDALVAGDVDVVLGVVGGQYIQDGITFSDSISNDYLCLIAPYTVAEEYKKNSKIHFRLAVENRLADYSLLSGIRTDGIVLTSNQYETFDKVFNDRAEMLVAVSEAAFSYMEDTETLEMFEIINNYVSAIDFTIATRKADYRLTSNISDGLANLRTDGGYEKIRNEWFSIEPGIDYRKILYYALIFIGVLMLFLSGYVIANKKAKNRLEKEVSDRTVELIERNSQIEKEKNLRGIILESNSSAIAYVDSSMNLIYMNNNALLLSGAKNWVQGQSLYDFPLFKHFAKFYENITGDEKKSSIWVFPYGKRKFRYSICENNESEMDKCYLITLDDITAEEHEREAMFEKEKNETLNSIIAGIAHEIKNPLTTINASASMIESKGDSERFRKAFAEHIPQEINRITRLINTLLDYARPDKGVIEKVSLNEIVKAVSELTSALSKYVEIKYESDKELYFLGDRDKTIQAILNVVFNSIEAIQRKYEGDSSVHYVDIKQYIENDEIYLVVHDDGAGMSEEALSHCMDPFYTTKMAGTGIGLAITRQSIEDMGGSIIVKSVENEFTEVTFRLPGSKE